MNPWLAEIIQKAAPHLSVSTRGRIESAVLAHLGERRDLAIKYADTGDPVDIGALLRENDTLRAQAAAHGEEIKRLAEALAGVHNVSDDKTREIERQAAAHGESVRELQVRMLKVTEMLEEALQHATEYRDGCLYCGEGDIIDGTTTPEHRATCWWYRGRALLAEVGKS